MHEKWSLDLHLAVLSFFLKTHIKTIESSKQLFKNKMNFSDIWIWKDFPVYKYNGIPFAADLARVKITSHVYGSF